MNVLSKIKSVAKSAKGFTLVELVVVIVVLGVIAAVAIPTVAGIIDRANKAADATTTKEATSAITRFASEFEMIYNDVAQGTVDTDDIVYKRVKSATGLTIVDTANLDSLIASGGDFGSVNFYPTNKTAFERVIKSYLQTKGNMAVKQKGYHLFYSPSAGAIVVAKSTSTPTQLNGMISNSDSSTLWVDYSAGWRYWNSKDSEWTATSLT